MKKLFFFLLLSMCLLHTSYTTAQNGNARNKQFYIVVAGISVYNDVSDNLHFADQDAIEYYQQMRIMGIPEANMLLLTNQNATRFNILNAMNTLYTRATPTDEIIFFFSGHGDKGLFVTHDIPNYLLHSDVKAAFKKSRANTKLIFADACFSGSLKALPKQAAMPKTEAASKKYYKNLEAGGLNVAVFVSSRSTQISAETSRHEGGIFTYYLLKALRGSADINGDKLITLYETYKYVSDNVKQDSRQEQAPVMFGKFNPNLPIAKVK